MDREHRDERDQDNFMESDVESKGEKEFRRSRQHLDMDHIGDTDGEVNYLDNQILIDFQCDKRI